MCRCRCRGGGCCCRISVFFYFISSFFSFCGSWFCVGATFRCSFCLITMIRPSCFRNLINEWLRIQRHVAFFVSAATASLALLMNFSKWKREGKKNRFVGVNVVCPFFLGSSFVCCCSRNRCVNVNVAIAYRSRLEHSITQQMSHASSFSFFRSLINFRRWWDMGMCAF